MAWACSTAGKAPHQSWWGADLAGVSQELTLLAKLVIIPALMFEG